MYYIGMDCHIANLEFAVVNEKGKVVKRGRVSTSAKGMMDFIRSVPRPRKVIVEEGCLAAWIKEVCEMYQEELIISDPKENRWISQAGKKEDTVDAEKLAQLARGNFLKEIYHPMGEKRRFRELVLAYHDLVSMEIRLKNKIKAKFRENGILCSGRTVYLEKHRGGMETENALPPRSPVDCGGIMETIRTNPQMPVGSSSGFTKGQKALSGDWTIYGVGWDRADSCDDGLCVGGDTPSVCHQETIVWIFRAGNRCTLFGR